MNLRRAFVVSVVAALAGACGSDGDAAPSCAPPLVAANGACAPRFDDCRAFEIPVLGGGCRAVGVPSDGCAAGFAHDGAGGCEPILPSTPCGDGEHALPGDTACHPVGVCAPGHFGDAPIDAATVYVDASAAPGGDGSETRPFRTIGEGLAKAAGALPLIAVAAGTYDEDVLITREVRLWGACASKVEIRGKGTSVPAVWLRSRAVVHGVSVTGPSWGIAVAEGGAIEAVRVHDTGKTGVELYGPVTVRDVLVERPREDGVYVEGAAPILERVTIRDVRPSATGKSGNGLLATVWIDEKRRSDVLVRASVIERATEAGVSVVGSRLSIEGSIVRDTRPRATDRETAIGVYATRLDAFDGELSIEGSSIERNQRAGVYVRGAKATLVRTVVRATAARASDSNHGEGIDASEHADVTLQECLVAANHYVGVGVWGSKAILDRTIVRDTAASAADGTRGIGVAAEVEAASGTAADVRITTSLITGNHTAGVSVGASTLVLEASAIVGTKPEPATGTFGDGLFVGARARDGAALPASAEISGSVIERNARAGAFVFSAAASLGRTTLRCNGFGLEVSSALFVDATGAPAGPAPSLDDRGDVVCGCGGALERCRAASTGLTPIMQSPTTP